MAADIGARDWQGAGVGVFTPRDSAQVFFLSLDPFLPYVRAHSSHISPLNSFTSSALVLERRVPGLAFGMVTAWTDIASDFEVVVLKMRDR